ncbi:hypothetical protein ACJRO7_034061 [Eucalyptus globulus]|uniref:L-ascorbate oxidase n=1 Tax=Eucalyptus globulus TaxID=34317 RepID=A0ABD3JAW0_EUCGL
MSQLIKLLLCVFVMMASANAKVRRYKWDVKYEFMSLDCYKKLAITINGKTSCHALTIENAHIPLRPAIVAQQGDTVIVEVTNSLVTKNLAILYETMISSWTKLQIGSPWSDWTGGMTQCPILSRDTFTHHFVVDRLPDGMVEPFAYDYDKSIILSDWYHQSTYEQTAGLSSIPFTYSVLIKIDQELSRNYWITTNVVGRNATATTPPGLAVLNYYLNHPKQVPPTDPLAIKAYQGYIHIPPSKSDRVIVFLNMQNKIDGYARWSMNNVSLTLPHTPDLIALKENLHNVFDQWPLYIYRVANNTNATSSDAIYRLKFNTTVEIILQNANTMTANNSATHPWHLHGHDFWVLGYGMGKFDISNDPKKYNLANPIMKNTLRFVADNPGVWLFHCHIESQLYMGMGVVFEEGVEKVGKLPLEIMGCGETKGFKRP